MTTIKTVDFPIDVNDTELEGVGTLLVTDHRLLLPHDSQRMARIMNLGAFDDGYGITWHIMTNLRALEAANELHSAWREYFDYCCIDKAVMINANVIYVGSDSETFFSRRYGFPGGSISGTVTVYCQEFWLSAPFSDWLVECGSIPPLDDDAVSRLEADQLRQLQERIGQSLLATYATAKLVVVSPADSEPGYSARGFELVQEDD
ncbi:hypothetical protein KY386_02000 [Candidatus Parcubacteria bacterium]|nr:hypothetical protein [Candidatus Parcubacteria bacterium]